jgi:hypothetical protein
MIIIFRRDFVDGLLFISASTRVSVRCLTKRAIYDVVTNTHPALVLFQEFSWTSIRSRAWKDYSWPEHLQYTGHNDASILFDINEVTLEEYTQKLLDDTLRDLPPFCWFVFV